VSLGAARVDGEFLERALAVAQRAADAAQAVVVPRYRAQDFSVVTKSDLTPVTEADCEAEAAIKRVLREAFPDHAFFGEEEGREGEGDFLWLIDPIDGTKAFVRGYPMFSTQIALMHRGELVLGVSDAPVYGERAWAVRGGGAFLRERGGAPRALRVSTACELDATTAISTGNLKSLAASPLRWNAYADLVRRVGRIRGYGDFLHYHLLARGAIDLVIESDLNILDIAPLVVIVREAAARSPISTATPSASTRAARSRARLRCMRERGRRSREPEPASSPRAARVVGNVESEHDVALRLPQAIAVASWLHDAAAAVGIALACAQCRSQARIVVEQHVAKVVGAASGFHDMQMDVLRHCFAGIAAGTNAAQAVASVRIGAYPAAQAPVACGVAIQARGFRVNPAAIGVIGVDDDAGARLPARIAHEAGQFQRFAGLSGRGDPAMRAQLRGQAVECRFATFAWRADDNLAPCHAAVGECVETNRQCAILAQRGAVDPRGLRLAQWREDLDAEPRTVMRASDCDAAGCIAARPGGASRRNRTNGDEESLCDAVPTKQSRRGIVCADGSSAATADRRFGASHRRPLGVSSSPSVDACA
jgi:histidinol-phosphatase